MLLHMSAGEAPPARIGGAVRAAPSKQNCTIADEQGVGSEQAHSFADHLGAEPCGLVLAAGLRGQEVSGLSFAAQANHRDITTVRKAGCLDVRPRGFVKSPDKFQEFPVKPLRTTFREGGPLGLEERTSQSPRKTQPTRRFKNDNNVGARQSEIKRLAIIALAHPCIPGNRGGDAAAEPFGIGLFPSRAPIQQVEVDYRQAELPAQFPG
jgi:hypothetical protein